MQRLAIVVLFGVASCQPGPHELTDFERSAVTAEIEKEAQEFLDAMFARDIERWSSPLRRDGFEMLINGDLRESYEEVRRSRSRKLESWAKAEGAWDGARVRVLSPNAAVFRGYAHATIEITSGETVHFPKNFFTLVFERLDDGWKISSIHESFDFGTLAITPASTEEMKESSGN